MLEPLLGSSVKEKILLYLQECDEGYALEIAKNFGFSISMIQFHLKKLEDDSVVVSKLMGKTRIFLLNPRYIFYTQLVSLLDKAIQLLPPTEIQKYYRPRKRPRRTGKPL